MLASLSACATVNQQDILDQKTHETELANRERNWKEKLNKLRSTTRALKHEIILLGNHPGWSELARIGKGYESILYLEGKEQAYTKTEIELLQWSKKWNANGPEIYLKYISLNERLHSLSDSWTHIIKEGQEIATFRDNLLNWRHSRKLITTEASILLMNYYTITDDKNIELIKSEVIDLSNTFKSITP